MPNLAELIPAVVRLLQRAGLEDAPTEARALAAAALKIDRAALLTRWNDPLTEEQQNRLQDFTARRAAREPLARLCGEKEFWSLPIGLNAATLEPRPDSETLIDAALALRPDRRAALRMLDLGTGSGCLLLALLHEYPHSRGVGIDRAADAVAMARQNAAALDMATRADFRVGDWGAELDGCFDIIISNPPYIPRATIATLAPEVRAFDPLLALDGGDDGLDAYRALAAQLEGLLTPDGLALFEIGFDQAESVPAIFRHHGFTSTLRRDLNGLQRVVIINHA